MAVVLMLGMLLQGCSTVPVTGRRSLNLVSSEQETQLGLTSFNELKSQTPVNRDPTLNAMLQRVGKQIAKVANKDMTNAAWEFVLFDSKEANAFCLPGGKVGVYTGILPVTKNDAGLATVLAHEIGHAVAHHGAERMTHQMLMQEGGQILGSTVAPSDPKWQALTMVAYGVIGKVGVELPFDRKQESEADHIGLIYMARAGYDPAEAVAFWQRFMEFNKAQGGNNTPAFLRTHPLDEVRIQQLQEWMPEAKAAFVKSPNQ